MKSVGVPRTPEFDIECMKLYDAGWNMAQVGRFVGVQPTTVRDSLLRHKTLARRLFETSYGTRKRERSIRRWERHAEAILDIEPPVLARREASTRIPYEEFQKIELLYRRGHSGREIARMLGVNSNTVYHRMQMVGIPCRSRSEALILHYHDQPERRERRRQASLRSAAKRGAIIFNEQELAHIVHLYWTLEMSALEVGRAMGLNRSDRHTRQLIRKALLRAGAGCRTPKQYAELRKRRQMLQQAA